MRKIVEYYCKYCKTVTKMKVSGPVKHLGVYWLKCSSCRNNWRVPVEEFESLIK